MDTTPYLVKEITPYNWATAPRKLSGRAINGPSMTVPNKSLTPKQLMDRFIRNQPVQGSVNPPEYEDSGIGVRLDSLDLSEQMVLLDDLNSRNRETRKQKEAKRRADAHLELESKIRAQIEASKPPETPPTE